MTTRFNARNARGGRRAATAKQQFLTFYRSGQYDKALASVEGHIRSAGGSAGAYSDAAVCCVYLERWDNAIAYAKRSLAINANELAALDALAHSHGARRQWHEVGEVGRRALELRDRNAPKQAPIDLPLLGPGNGRKIIAFSLFGGSSKYCETAVLNCIEQPAVYPGWTCRFYIDASVPANVRERIEQAGGEVLLVDDEMAGWPGPMWRFAAYDDPDVSTLIFRDADSVISKREADAVQEWLESGASFHAMRDSGSHTELLLAGLWAVKRGALPSLRSMIKHYLKKPVSSQRFADQYFLREYVWPYARNDVLQHDSLFGFGNWRPFPEGPHRDDVHVGYAEGSPKFAVETSFENGCRVEWHIFDYRGEPPIRVCTYPGLVSEGKVEGNIPARYAELLAAGAMRVKVTKP